MGGLANFGGFDDGLTSDGIGAGFTDSTTGFTGIDEGTIDDTSVGTVDPGAAIQADFTGGLTDAGQGDFWAGVDPLTSINLAGNSDTPPSSSGTLGISDNGAGYAPPSAGTTPAFSPVGINSALNALGKFGAGLASLISGSGAATVRGTPIGAPGSTVAGAPISPYGSGVLRTTAPSAISQSHTSLVLVIVGLLIVGILWKSHGE